MANDIVNTAGNTTGSAQEGRAVVIIAGKSSQNLNIACPGADTRLISSIASKYDARFDDTGCTC